MWLRTSLKHLYGCGHLVSYIYIWLLFSLSYQGIAIILHISYIHLVLGVLQSVWLVRMRVQVQMGSVVSQSSEANRWTDPKLLASWVTPEMLPNAIGQNGAEAWNDRRIHQQFQILVHFLNLLESQWRTLWLNSGVSKAEGRMRHSFRLCWKHGMRLIVSSALTQMNPQRNAKTHHSRAIMNGAQWYSAARGLSILFLRIVHKLHADYDSFWGWPIMKNRYYVEVLTSRWSTRSSTLECTKTLIAERYTVRLTSRIGPWFAGRVK